MNNSRRSTVALILMAASCAVVMIIDDSAMSVRESEGDEKSHAVLKVISDLRAYCTLAYDQAVDMKAGGAHGDSAIVNFIIAFGSTKTEKKMDEKEKQVAELNAIKDLDDNDDKQVAKHYNVIVDFAKSMKEVRDKFPEGINDYVISHLHDAVLGTEHTLKEYTIGSKMLIGIDSGVAGLSHDAEYLKKLAVSKVAFNQKSAEIEAKSKHADAAAAAMWLLSGEKVEYKSFLDKAKEARKNRISDHFAKTTSQSLKAIKGKFAETNDIHGLATVGATAADSVKPLVTKTDDEVEEDAARLAKEWAAKNAAKASGDSEEASVESGQNF